MNLNDSSTCKLPSYPSAVNKGPVVFDYLEDKNEIAACGTIGFNKPQNSDRNCYSLGSIWRPMGSMPVWKNEFCASPRALHTHFIRDFGWFLFGSEQKCYSAGNFEAAIYTANNSWTNKIISNPTGFKSGFPIHTCSVPLNKTHIFITGHLNMNVKPLVLNLIDSSWTSTAPMLENRRLHGCIMTPEGEVMIAGGLVGIRTQSYNVDIYNPTSDVWRRDGDLPITNDLRMLKMFVWDEKIIIFGDQTDRIWMRMGPGNWKLMKTSLGATLKATEDHAVIVPEGIFECPSTSASTTST